MFITTAFAQAADTAVESGALGTGSTLWSLLTGSHIVIQLIMVLLAIFSVIGWAIIGSKYKQLKRDKQRSEKFLKIFWQEDSIEKLVAKKSFVSNPYLNVFRSGIDALREVKHPQRHLIIQKEIRHAAEDEIETLESGVPFLATTGSSAPFIGLFGTVWGILYAFWKIGRTGSSSLAIIGPHLAEALITTAAGLAVAIPAVIFYNYFVTKIRLMSKDLLDFSDDLYYRLEKEYLSKEK